MFTIIIISPLFLVPLLKKGDLGINVCLGLLWVSIIMMCVVFCIAWEDEIKKWIKSNWKKAGKIEKKWRKR
jgi:hypothetical protein